MTQLKLHSPVLGKNPGETVDLPTDEAEWYLQNGYAAKVRGKDDPEFGMFATSADADADPTLSENREAPGEPEDHLSNVDETPTAAQVKVETNDKGKAAEPTTAQPSGGPKNIPTPSE